MRLRGPYVAISALGLAVLAVSVVAVWTSVSRARTFQAITEPAAITINGTDNTFAPPPPGTVPGMTAAQAWSKWERDTGQKVTKLGANTTAQLGLLTSPIGPDCGVSCSSWTVQNGIAYRALNQLAYGYSWLAFPRRHLKNRNWIFLDASTGKMIIGVLSREPGSGPGPTATDY